METYWFPLFKDKVQIGDIKLTMFWNPGNAELEEMPEDPTEPP